MTKILCFLVGYGANLLHGLVHVALSLTYRRSPAWLLRLHDATALVAWPELQGRLTAEDLAFQHRTLKSAYFALLLHSADPTCRDAFFLVRQALKDLPPSHPERFDHASSSP